MNNKRMLDNAVYCCLYPHHVCIQALIKEYKPAQFIFPDGSLYEGEVVEGDINGNGKYIGADGVTLEGTFVNGQLEGHGRRSTKNG